MTSLIRRLALIVSLAAIVLTLAGCGRLGALGEPHGGPYPEACAQWQYSDARCAAIVDRAEGRAELDPSLVSSIELLPFDRHPELGGYQVALVRFRLVDGTIVTKDVWCIGIDDTRVCNEVAEIRLSFGVDHDVPCAGEPPDGCATLPPEPDASAVAAASPFRLASIDIPVDHRGLYDVELGSATLPDGYLSERSFNLADRSPDRFWIDDGVRLEVRPDIGGRPPVGSVYRDPFDGPEPVTIFIVFEVTQLDSPSVLRVRDVVVR